MATDKINNYSIGDNNFESVMLTLDQTFRNKHDCYSFSATALKAGSVIEINGSLYPVTQDVTLPDMTSKKYLMAVPSSAGTFTLLATSTAPTWSDAKQGFYGTSTTANYKYIAVKEGTTIYKYNDRPFYVGAIYTASLNMSGDITCDDITCDDITCADITCDDITNDTITSNLTVSDEITCSTYSSFTINIPPNSNTVYTITKPTSVIVPKGGSVEIWDGSGYVVWHGGALNPARYKFGGGVESAGGSTLFTFIGAAMNTSMSSMSDLT